MLRRQAKDILLQTDSPEMVAEFQKRWDERFPFQAARLDDLQKYATRKQDKERVKVMRTELAAYNAVFAKVLGPIQDGRIKTVRDANRAI